MKLFAGLSRTDYEDLLRAVGALIDERGWSNVSLTEVDEGVIVQVMVKPTLRQTRPHLETYLLTDADLERVQRDAVRRRQKKAAPAPPSAPAADQSASPGAGSARPPLVPPIRPVAGRMVEDHLATLVAQGRGAQAPAQTPPVADEPLPPLPALDGLPTERGLSIGDGFDESLFFPQTGTARSEEDAPIFAPAPMRFTPAQEPPPPAYDAGAARAAVVMAHIVAARIKSGVPISGDDPDLESLLEQVRALDDAGIGTG